MAALAEGREAHVFGRRALPETDLASVTCAIQNLWLAARARRPPMTGSLAIPKSSSAAHPTSSSAPGATSAFALNR
jgi:nitroreductase